MFDRHRYPRVVILQAVYFKLRFTLSYRDLNCFLISYFSKSYLQTKYIDF